MVLEGGEVKRGHSCGQRRHLQTEKMEHLCTSAPTSQRVRGTAGQTQNATRCQAVDESGKSGEGFFVLLFISFFPPILLLLNRAVKQRQ